MRKGFSLIEMIVVLAAFTALSLPLSLLITTTLRDIPNSFKVIQVNTSVLNMLRQLRKDIDIAVALPESVGRYTTDNKHLLIELPTGMICYRLQDAEIHRLRLTSSEKDDLENTASWSVPAAEIQWQVWRKPNYAFAVEIKTCIEQKRQGHPQKKMTNSHLFFMGAFQETIEQR